MARLGRWLDVDGAIIRPYALAGVGIYYSWMSPGAKSLQGKTSGGVDVSGPFGSEPAKDR